MGSSLWVTTYGGSGELFLKERELDARLRRAQHERFVAFWSRVADAIGQRWHARHREVTAR